jgi:hypothetical protein
VGQNFDSLASGGTNNAWSNDVTLPGWSLFNKDFVAITTYNAGIGDSNVGNFYSFGGSASSERALGGVASGGAYFGSPASGAVAGWMALSLVNNTGQSLSQATLSYSGEQWRNGGNANTQMMNVEYGIGPTFQTVSSWTAAPAGFSFSSPVTGATATAVDGNGAGRVAGLGGTIPLTWSNGDVLWFRWIENNDTGNDHGLALDDFSFVSNVPEPSVSLLVGAALASPFIRRRRQRQRFASEASEPAENRPAAARFPAAF